MRKLIVITFKGEDGAKGPLMKDSTTSEGWATMLVMEESITINNGILNHRKRVGAIRDKKENLLALGLKEGDDLNAVLGKEHRITYFETVEPQYEGQQPKVNPRNQEVIKNSAGQPIYLSAKVTEAGVEDQLIGNAKAAVVASGAEKIA